MSALLLQAPRQVTFDWHVVQAKKWLEFDGGKESDSVLVYAALELRTAIERYFFELLYLLKEGKLSKDDEKRCRSMNGILSLMNETDCSYRKTIEFTKLVASITPGVPEITIVDTAYLRRKWHALSEYCHMHLRPERTWESQGREFQRRGYALIHEVLRRFHEWEVESNCAVLAPSSFPEEVRNVYDKFVREEIDAGQAKRMLILMEPVLQARRGLR